MKLSELIDLEVQLLRDEQAVTSGRSDEITRRDRAIGIKVATAVGVEGDTAAQDLATDRGLRHRVCQAWLGLLPEDDRSTLPGARIEGGYRIIGWVLLGLFFFAGIGTATATLHGTDAQPINVLVFIVIFFVLQIALLVLYPVLMLLRRIRGRHPTPWLQGLVVRLSRVRLLDRWTGSSLRDLPETLDQLQMRQSIYGGVQRWMLFSLVQRMAMGFNFAALLTTFYMVLFYDLANSCWSTTLALDPVDLHRWLSWIATPWSWIDGTGAPSVDAIEHSRWETSGGSGYARDGTDAKALRRTWWPFLIVGLITWGLLPRTLAYAVGSFVTKRRSRRVPLNHMTVQHLFERLFSPTTAWAGPDPESVRGAPPAKPTKPMRAPKHLDPSAACYIVCWGTLNDDVMAVEAHIRNRFHRAIKKTLSAGLADVSIETATVRTLERARAGRVVVVMPEGQQPTKDVTRFLGELRKRLGAECEVVVGLLARTANGFGNVDQDEIETWRSRLLAEGDPYLSLQTMERGT